MTICHEMNKSKKNHLQSSNLIRGVYDDRDGFCFNWNGNFDFDSL